MSVPTAATPGYREFRGRVACRCLAQWLPEYETMLRHEGVLGPDELLPIAQLVGDAPASKGTHYGGAFDLWTVDPRYVKVARQMGADATWVRDTGSFVNNKHIHGLLTGCPHNVNARYQLDAVRANYNGLGIGGRSGPDTGPRPLSGRSWREGIAWANQQREEDMDIKEQLDRIEAIATEARDQARRAREGSFKRDKRQLALIVQQASGTDETLEQIMARLDELGLD